MITFSLPRKNVPDISLLMQVQNHPDVYLIDCGALQSYSVRQLQRVRAVFVTHTHVDHWIDFDTLLRHQVQHNIEVVICGPVGITDHVRAKLQAYNWNLLDEQAATYRVREIVTCDHVLESRLEPPRYQPSPVATADTVIYEDDAIRADCVLLDHHIPSVAYRFTTPDRIRLHLDRGDLPGGPWAGALKEAYLAGEGARTLLIDGRSVRADTLFHLIEREPGTRVGVILDHAIHPDNRHRIRQHFTGADAVYIESYFLERDRELALQKAHSTAVASARTLSGIGITKAVPIHHSRKYSDAEIAALEQEFHATFYS